MGQKVTITETEETPIAPGVKIVRDVTEDPEPKQREVVKETVIVEKKIASD